ncbi:hypothetical protein SPI_02506 [Niveomyces insectorum RCEF 264]|uniref:Acid phosphatase-like protein n=1 Tax=Niveomyces insectorum RCEF 264 TaxID=1081102 RepID=A0A167Y1R5_9HYPO|nr:hypothetical protein SPI_02506 [Niveomyces insectorum RCEF 264]
MRTAGVIVLVIILLLAAAGVGWVLFARFRAQRLGLPPPSWSSFVPFSSSSRSSYGVQPAPGGVGGWINDRWRRFKNRNNRTAVGAYEGAGGLGAGRGGPTRRGFGPLDPDDAWDARVGAEADAYYYNEEQELGLHPGQGSVQSQPGGSNRLNVGNNTGYVGAGGSSYDMNLAADVGVASADRLEDEEVRGRTRGRSPQGGLGAGGPNPFDDDADPSNISLRGVSPRPIVDTASTASRVVGDATSHGNDKADSPTERRSMFRENV